MIEKVQVVGSVGNSRSNSFSHEDFKAKMPDKNAARVNYTANQNIVCKGKPAPKPVRSTSIYGER